MRKKGPFNFHLYGVLAMWRVKYNLSISQLIADFMIIKVDYRQAASLNLYNNPTILFFSEKEGIFMVLWET